MVRNSKKVSGIKNAIEVSIKFYFNRHLKETGKLQEASLVKKKQRGILVNHQKETHEMRR